MKESPAKIDVLLEPLLVEGSDAQAERSFDLEALLHRLTPAKGRKPQELVDSIAAIFKLRGPSD